MVLEQALILIWLLLDLDCDCHFITCAAEFFMPKLDKLFVVDAGVGPYMEA